eukprot:sb/3465592/
MSNYPEFLILTTAINVRTGPTYCGGEEKDPGFMRELGCTLVPSTSQLGSMIYQSPKDITEVMQKASFLGYNVISTSGLGQTFIVTMQRPQFHMVTRGDVWGIFTECDRDSDGIVWLSELRALAASYTSLEDDVERTENDEEEEEDVPLDFEQFWEKFAAQMNIDVIPVPLVNGEVEEESRNEQQKGTVQMDGLASLGTSSGVSGCSPRDDDITFAFSPASENYEEEGSNEEDGEEVLGTVVGRKSSPFRQSIRRSKGHEETMLTVNKESELREEIENLKNKVIQDHKYQFISLYHLINHVYSLLSIIHWFCLIPQKEKGARNIGREENQIGTAWLHKSYSQLHGKYHFYTVLKERERDQVVPSYTIELYCRNRPIQVNNQSELVI